MVTVAPNFLLGPDFGEPVTQEIAKGSKGALSHALVAISSVRQPYGQGDLFVALSIADQLKYRKEAFPSHGFQEFVDEHQVNVIGLVGR